MYALLAIVVAFPLIRSFRQPLVVTWPVQGAYDTIEKMPADKLAIIWNHFAHPQKVMNGKYAG